MSIVFSVLLLLLIGFSFHACGARALGVIADHHHSINKESEEKLNPDSRVSSTPSMPNDPKVGSESDDNDLDHGVGSVQWRVPHRKKGGAVAEFNLDYLPPKTHPPVHN